MVTNSQQNQAIAHDKWFRRQVELGLAGLEAGKAVGEKEHAARWNKRRASLLKRARGAWRAMVEAVRSRNG